MSGDWDDPLVDTPLSEEQRDQIEAYAARGRPFQPLSVDALSHAWAAACIDVAFGDDGQLVELSFLANELVARGLHPPEELIPPQARQAFHDRTVRSTRFQAVTDQIGRVRQRLGVRLPGPRASRPAHDHDASLEARGPAREDETPSALIALTALFAEPIELPASERADDGDCANCANCAIRSGTNFSRLDDDARPESRARSDDGTPSALIALTALFAEPIELAASERTDDGDRANCANCAIRSATNRAVTAGAPLGRRVS